MSALTTKLQPLPEMSGRQTELVSNVFRPELQLTAAMNGDDVIVRADPTKMPDGFGVVIPAVGRLSGDIAPMPDDTTVIRAILPDPA